MVLRFSPILAEAGCSALCFRERGYGHGSAGRQSCVADKKLRESGSLRRLVSKKTFLVRMKYGIGYQGGGVGGRVRVAEPPTLYFLHSERSFSSRVGSPEREKIGREAADDRRKNPTQDAHDTHFTQHCCTPYYIQQRNKARRKRRNRNRIKL